MVVFFFQNDIIKHFRFQINAMLVNRGRDKIRVSDKYQHRNLIWDVKNSVFFKTQVTWVMNSGSGLVIYNAMTPSKPV